MIRYANQRRLPKRNPSHGVHTQSRNTSPASPIATAPAALSIPVALLAALGREVEEDMEVVEVVFAEVVDNVVEGIGAAVVELPIVVEFPIVEFPAVGDKDTLSGTVFGDVLVIVLVLPVVALVSSSPETLFCGVFVAGVSAAALALSTMLVIPA